MQEPRLVRLGKVTVRDGDIRIEVEPEVEVEARPHEELLFAVFYDFREASPEQEHVHLTVEAHLAGAKVRGDTRLRDRPVLADDRRGYFSVPVQAPRSGTVEGTAEVRGEYSLETWVGDAERTSVPVEATVPLRVRVRPGP